MMKTTEFRPAVKSGVIYIRVSSKEQEKEGYSLPAQKKLLQGYAKNKGISILKVFKDSETAKTTGRTHFNEMIQFLQKNPQCKVVVVEKTDRLYRNIKDWVILDDLKLELHFVKEGGILSEESSSNEKLLHGFKVVIAKNYVENLSEEARKGMLAKAESGMFPSVAPVGYENFKTTEGRREIRPDPKTAPIVKRLFEIFRTGDVSVTQLMRIARTEGLSICWNKKDRAPGKSTLHRMLRNRIYMGEYLWNDELYQGTYEPIVSRQLWSEVQDVLALRNERKTKQKKHNFTFSRLLTCGHCGCSLVGETHKNRYTYYSCSGYKGKCGEPYVREEVLDGQFYELLESLEFDEEVISYLKDTVQKTSEEEREYRRNRVAELRLRLSFCKRKITEIYNDKLEGLINAEMYRNQTDKHNVEIADLQTTISAFESLEDDGLLQGIEFMELVRNARRMYILQPSSEKRSLVRNLLSNCSWKNGKLSAEFRHPYDMIANTKKLHDQKKAAGDYPGGLYPIWRSGRDSNSQLPT